MSGPNFKQQANQKEFVELPQFPAGNPGVPLVDTNGFITMVDATNLVTPTPTLTVKDEGSDVDAAVASMDFVGPGVQVTQNSAGNVQVQIDGTPRSVYGLFEGAGVVLPNGLACDVPIDFAGTITGWTILTDDTGNITFNVHKCALGSFPGGLASITASAPPSLSATDHGASSTLTGWTTTVAAGDVLRLSVASNVLNTRATLVLTIQPT